MTTIKQWLKLNPMEPRFVVEVLEHHSDSWFWCVYPNQPNKIRRVHESKIPFYGDVESRGGLHGWSFEGFARGGAQNEARKKAQGALKSLEALYPIEFDVQTASDDLDEIDAILNGKVDAILNNKRVKKSSRMIAFLNQTTTLKNKVILTWMILYMTLINLILVNLLN